MKRLLGILTAFVLLAGIPAHALENPVPSPDRVDIHDVLVVGAPSFTPLRATSAPTSYAPASWYNANHAWTATTICYSSYYFNTTKYPYLDISANASFKIEFYMTDGTYWGEVTPSYNSSTKKYSGAYAFNPDEDYYFLIRNLSGSPITSGASYKVSN